MKHILTIIKKELLRVFKDKLLIIALLLPGVMIFLMYNFMGEAFADIQNPTYFANVVTVNAPSQVDGLLKAEELDFNAHFESANQANLDSNLEKIQTGELSILVVFGENFANEVANGNKPQIEIYFNPTDTNSTYAFEKVQLALTIYQNMVLADRQIDPVVFTQTTNPIYDEASAIAGVFAMMLPMLLITFLFSSGMSLAPDSIAGEKERGTISTILITPVKRSNIALGKIIGLSILAIASAFSSFVGLMLSLPKMLGGVDLLQIYSVGEFALLFLVIISTVLLIVAVMSVLSTLAKTIKEASMLIMPFMLVSMVVSILSMTGGGPSSNFLTYLIPIFNSAQAMGSILTFDVNVTNLIITFAVNIVYMVLCALIMTRLFNSEKVMFKK